jgi:DNA-binding NarL/FixJ family response regulator
MGWIGEPLTFYALLATGLILCLVLFVSLKRENMSLRSVLENDRRLTVGKMEEFRNSMLRFQAALDYTQAEARLLAEPHSADAVPALQSVNLSKRSLALRMYRRGETSEQIASALNVPRNEVELLLKVQKTVLEEV